LYELRDRLGTYINAWPSIEMSRGATLMFQTPRKGGSLSSKVRGFVDY
jgi:hypothetical protein